MSSKITKLLIANRGEIAVRIIRTCRDRGIRSVAIYAKPDSASRHVTLADEAYSLGGSTPSDSYLAVDKIIEAAAASGADSVHPGYGFLSENADFAQAVLDAGLVWIGPSPNAIRALGDKVAARKIAAEVGAPLVPGTADPVECADDVVAFANAHGLPIAIKAAFGGGGRGLKVAWEIGDIPELFDSARREAVAAFGRGECFVERYLDKPRHVETQCLADEHSNVVVVSTRDCSLQRRHQKLVEEAPAPFLTAEQNERITTASKAILRRAGYVGAGTCEFLVGSDGSLSFLEVNTRLQVEHPVTEEVTGIDLVDEQLRIAEGEPLGYTDPPPHGHAFEFRINAEDPGRSFLPGPGRITRFDIPSGPGVRIDSGVVVGDELGAAWDSLLAKLIVSGPDRATALRRARRALHEFAVDGVPTVLPFHRAIVSEPDFVNAPMRVHTRWIEDEFTETIAPQQLSTALGSAPDSETLVVEVNGRRVEVTIPVDPSVDRRAPARRPRSSSTTMRAVSADALIAPMLGTVVKVAVVNGDTVAEGDLVAVIEAMKMEQPLKAHRPGVIAGMDVRPGSTISGGSVLCRIDPSD